ncbi:MAG: DUF447 domain-containing protein [Halobacteriaceae archaeon]
MTDWPVALRGVTETVTTTRGPDGAWNAAALGVHAGDPATAKTWGGTRTRRNFERESGGYVQFVRDPVLFAEAALGVREVSEPILDAADAWAQVEVARVDSGVTDGTEWVEWALSPAESAVEKRTVPTTNRGYGAVVEATVAASRLGVAGYDDARLRARLDYFDGVVRRCGGARERTAIDRVAALSDWDRGASRNEPF